MNKLASPIILLFAIVALFASYAGSATAQVVDSLAVTSDSLVVVPDSISVDSLLIDPVPPRRPARRVARIAPVPRILSVQSTGISPPSAIELEIVDQVSHLHGAFLYDLSTPGWPSLWTIRGRPPLGTSITWNGIVFDELFTGRPAFELLPRGLIDTVSVGTGIRTAPTIAFATRGFEKAVPVTELSYRTSNKGMQYVYASHYQQRVRNVFSRPSRVGIRLGYMGQKADGEYPSSQLERVRGVYGVLSVQRGAVGLEISDLANRRRVGAHSGVVPAVPGDPDSIYNRFGALVNDHGAERRTLRNDLTTRLSYSPDSSSLESVQLTTGWTQQSFRYRGGGDTLFVKSQRLSSQLDFGFDLADVTFGIHSRISEESIIDDGIVAEGDRVDLNRLSIWLSSSYDGTGQVSGLLGVNRVLGTSSLEASASAMYPLGAFQFEANASRAIPDMPLITATGFGDAVIVQGGARSGYLSEFVGHLRYLPSTSSISLSGFANIAENARDWFSTSNSDSIVFRPVGSTLTTTGMVIALGFRDRASRGFYIDTNTTLLATASTTIGGFVSPLAARPSWYGDTRTGFRYLLFSDDLDADIALRARYWPDYAGRTLHTQTGLLAVPLTAGKTISSSAVLDFIFEGGIRGATVLLAYENLLSGTEIVIGNQLVPGYPLAQRRLRFGIYWPILN